ncbi:MAG TPA: hypothetical protein VFO16_06115 [Pseudonocardiaceae bacterium]|nr:hypothetical protein [Pseudonocardiaceae bacterium]
MTDRIQVRELAACDGFALRVGDGVLVYVSTGVPSSAREAVARHLIDVVRSARGARYASASLAVGDAKCLVPIPDAAGSTGALTALVTAVLPNSTAGRFTPVRPLTVEFGKMRAPCWASRGLLRLGGGPG